MTDHRKQERPGTLRLANSDEHNDDKRVVKLHRNRHGEISLTVPSRHIRHLERFWKRHCAVELWMREIYPDLKEISEAEAMRNAIVHKLRLDPGTPRTIVIAVGDGHTPRLGALLAYTTAWKVVSIDPKAKSVRPTIQRLTVIARRVENVLPETIRTVDPTAERIIIAAPHSHASLDDAVDLARQAFPDAHIDAIAMPCCIRQSVRNRHTCDRRYEDLGVWSGKAVVQIWKGIEIE